MTRSVKPFHCLIVLSIVGVLVVAGGIGAAVMLTGGSGDETASAADGETAAATAEPSGDPEPADTGATATAEPTATAEASSDTGILASGPDKDVLEQRLIPWLASTTFIVTGVIPVRRSLEDVFLEVTR